MVAQVSVEELVMKMHFEKVIKELLKDLKIGVKEVSTYFPKKDLEDFSKGNLHKISLTELKGLLEDVVSSGLKC